MPGPIFTVWRKQWGAIICTMFSIAICFPSAGIAVIRKAVPVRLIVVQNKKSHMRKLIVPLLIALLLTACESAGSQQSSLEEGITTLTYATLTPDKVNREAVKQFNQQHRDVQIEVKDYSSPDEGAEKNGRDRLLTEIISGSVPDIIDFGSTYSSQDQLPYRQMVEKGYLEDLWPYIINDPDLGPNGVLEAPLRAAEIDGGLYMVFDSVTVQTLTGAEDMVGNRTSWTLEDLREAFSAMPENSTILEYCQTKRGMFRSMLPMELDSYVDWETGQCSFDSSSFRTALEFVNSYPLEFERRPDEEVNREITKRRMDGRQMLAETVIGHFTCIQVHDAEFDGRAAYVGYPMEDGSTGSSFHPQSTRLAISTTCRDKEAAWSFVRQMLLPRIDSVRLSQIFGEYAGVFPVNRIDYETMKKRAQKPSNYSEKDVCYLFSWDFSDDFPKLQLRAVTDEEISRLEDFLNSIDKISVCDPVIYDIVLNVAGSYFAGDKTLDETVDLIQRQASLYVNENR